MATEILKRDCFDVLNPAVSLNDSEGYKVHQVQPSGNNNQGGLNSGQEITFTYAGSSRPIRLDPMRCGFRVRAAFRTRSTQAGLADAAKLAADKAAKITLAPNWFWHLFTNYKLDVANANALENLSNLGVYADAMALFKGSEYRRTYGEASGYIPDECSGEADDTQFTATNAAIAAGQAVPANITTIVSNNNFNAGFARRLKKYNYPLPDADTTRLRYVEEFIPLSLVSGFFSLDKVLMNTRFEIKLTRKASDAFQDAVFGAANTGIEFGNTPDTGIINLRLELYEQLPTLLLSSELNSIYENSDKTPIPLAFLKATCTAQQMENQDTFPVNFTNVTVPRYVMVTFKGIKTNAPDARAPDEANQEGSMARNFSLFANADIENIQVTINGDEYPSSKQNTEFGKNYFSEFYNQYIETCTSLGQDPSVSMDEFKNLYPVFAFDCSDQKKKLSTQTTNLSVNVKRKAVPNENADRKNPRNLKCYITVLEDTLVKLNAKQGIASVMSVID